MTGVLIRKENLNIDTHTDTHTRRGTWERPREKALSTSVEARPQQIFPHSPLQEPTLPTR